MNDLDTRLRHMAREEETPVPKDFDENLTRTLAQLPARKRRRIPRAVLLAACLVLMLTGAVLAAESGVFARFGTPGDLNVEGLFYDGTEYGGTWTYSTDRRLPLADIPQASQEAARTSTEDLQFPDMAAADAFLGGGVLPRSAQQEARERDQVSIEAQCDQQGQLVRMYIRTAYCDELQNPDGGIRYGDYMHVWMYVLTDVTPEDDVVSWIYSQGQLKNLEQLEDYKAPGGGKAYIFRETIPGYGNRYRALFCEGPVVVQLDLSIMTDGSLVGGISDADALAYLYSAVDSYGL